MELRQAFLDKGIDKNWLVDRLKDIGENQEHKSQLDVLMLIGRVIGAGLDEFKESAALPPSDTSNLLMGYSRRQITEGSTDRSVEEAAMIGPPESVRAALQGTASEQ